MFHLHFKCNSRAFQQRFILKLTLSHPIKLVYFICIKIQIDIHFIAGDRKDVFKIKNCQRGDRLNLWGLAVNSTLFLLSDCHYNFQRAVEGQACVWLSFQPITWLDIIFEPMLCPKVKRKVLNTASVVTSEGNINNSVWNISSQSQYLKASGTLPSKFSVNHHSFIFVRL